MAHARIISVDIDEPPDPSAPCTSIRHTRWAKRRLHVENSLLPQIKRMQFETAEITRATVPHDFAVSTDTLKWNDTSFKISYSLSKNPDFIEYQILSCFLSHFRLWNLCIELNTTLLILEDDAWLPADREPYVRETIAYYERIADENCILYLQSQVPYLPNSMKSYPKHTYMTISGPLIRLAACNDLSGTAAYCVRPSAAKKLLSRSIKVGIEAADCIVHQSFNTHEIGVYVVEKECFLLNEHWAAWNH